MAVHVLNALPPLIQVGISVGRSYLSRGLGGSPVMKTALIDTGSSMTAIAFTITAALRPLRLGTVKLTRPGGTTIRRNRMTSASLSSPTPSTPDGGSTAVGLTWRPSRRPRLRPVSTS